MGSISTDELTSSAQAIGSIHFLKRLPLYKAEKPYTIRYQLPEDSKIPRTNSEHEEVSGIPIVRPLFGHPRLYPPLP